MKQKTNRIRTLGLQTRLLLGLMVLAVGVLAVAVPKATADDSGPSNHNYIIVPPADDPNLRFPGGSNPMGANAPRIQFVMDNTLPGQNLSAGTSVAYIPYQFLLTSSEPRAVFQMRGGAWQHSCDSSRDWYDRKVNDNNPDDNQANDGSNSPNPCWIIGDFIKKRGLLSPVYYEVYQLSGDNARNGRLLGVINPRDRGIFPSLDTVPSQDNCEGGGCWRQFDIGTAGGSITVHGGNQDSCHNRNNVWNVPIQDKCTQPVFFSMVEPSTDPNARTLADRGPPDIESDLRNALALKDTTDTTDESPAKPKPKQTANELLKKYGSGVGEFFLGGTAKAFHVNNQTRAFTVYVNPRDLSPGQVTVQISGGNCAGNVKTVGGDGSVTFGGCPSAGHSYNVWVHQSNFDRGPNGGDNQPSYNCSIGDGAKLQTNVGGTVNFEYNCTRRITVWANPRDWTGGAVTAQVTGGACNDNQKLVNSQGYALFAGCPYVGHTYNANVHESHFEKEGGAVECDIPQSDKTSGVGSDNNVNFYYHCFRNTPIATDGGIMSEGQFKLVNDTRFNSSTQPNLNGNYVFLIKAVAYSDIGNGYVTTFDRLFFGGSGLPPDQAAQYHPGCTIPTDGNAVNCPKALLDRADAENTKRIIQNGFYLRAPKQIGANTRQYLATAPSKISFGVSYGPIGPVDQNPQGHYEGLHFQAGGTKCRASVPSTPGSPYSIPTADWDLNKGWVGSGPGFEGQPTTPDQNTPIEAKLNRVGVRDDLGNLYQGTFDQPGYPPFTPVASKDVHPVSISGSWQSSTSNLEQALGAHWVVRINNPDAAGGTFSGTSWNYSPEGSAWQDNEAYAGQLAIRQWNQGNQLLQGGQAFTTGFWPTCRQPGVELQTPKDGYTYDGQNSDNPVNADGVGGPDYVDGFLTFKFTYGMPEFRPQVKYKVEFSGPDGVASKNTPHPGIEVNNVSAGTQRGSVPIQVGDLRSDTSYSWRVCVTTNNWNNQNCSGNWSFKVNQGPAATVMSGNAMVPNTNTDYPGNDRPNKGVYYKCTQLGSRLTDPEAAPAQVRPYYKVSWTANGQLNTVDTYTRQGTSDNNSWSNWKSGNYGYKDDGSAFTSDEVSPRSWRRGGSLVSLSGAERSMSMTDFLREPKSATEPPRVPDGVDVFWDPRGEDRFGAADLSPALGDLLSLYNNSNPFTAGGNNASLIAFDQQSPLVNRRFGLPPYPSTKFHKNTAPNFNTASTKKFKDLAGNVVTTATDGQTLQVETRMVNGGETPSKFYALRDYLGALRDFEAPTNITITKNNGATITLPADQVLTKVVADRQNGNDTMLPDEVDPKSADYVRGSWRIDLGSNQSGPLADPAIGGPGNVMNPGDIVTLTYQVRANRNQQLLATETNNNFSRKLTPADIHFWAYYQENYCDDANRVGKVIDKLPGTVAAPWLRGQRGSIAANGGIFGYDALAGQANATFLVQANGVLSHFTGGTGALPNYTSQQAVCTAPAQGERPGGVDWRRTMITNIGKLLDGSYHSATETTSTFNSSSGQVTLNPSGGANVWVVGSPDSPAGLTLSRSETFDGVGTLVVFGDLTIGPNVSLNYASDDGGINSLGVIVVGNLNIDASVTSLVGNYFVLDSDPELDAEGCPVNIDINKTTRGRVNTGSSANKLNVQGLIVAGAYDLLRYFINPSDTVADPAENIYYDGRVLANTPPGFGTFRNTASWQEIAP